MTFDPQTPYILVNGTRARIPRFAFIRVDKLPEPTLSQSRVYALVDAGVGEGARAAKARREIDAWAREALRQPKPWPVLVHANLARLGYIAPGSIKDVVFA